MTMNKPPAVVIIARHGARLDAADKQWHFTSPTPYDPPLTYGGWTQARALGAKIATILRAREESHEEHFRLANATGSESDRLQHRRRKHRVILHSSPFVRCVQTSIGISAGLAQYQKAQASGNVGRSNILRTASQRRGQERSPSLSSIPEPPEDGASKVNYNATSPPQKFRITQLRIDAFLGEWLSPDYFESITSPPSSVMMVAGAKAELLRPGERIEGAEMGDRAPLGHFPGGWKNGLGDSSSIDEEDDSDGLANLSSIGNALPRSSSSTHSAVDSRPFHKVSRIATGTNGSGQNYVAPAPTYAVSSSEPIPTGYVAHAREACVDVDYRWDSMRPPQDWGNGGEYGEEWSSMHKRFRNGLQKMIGWYKDEPAEAIDGEEDVDIVLILVTHGAGCNALIGALTNQPVLLDVGMASLTMAFRQETADQGDKADQGAPRPISPRQNRRESVIDTSISEEYDVKLVASTDHLRGGSTPSTPALGPSTRLATTPLRGNFSPISSNSFMDDSLRPSTSQGLHRSSSGAYRPHAAITTLKQSSGLWGSSTSTDTASESSDSDFMPNFENARVDPAEALAADGVKKAEMTNGDARVVTPQHVPARTASQRGLWGAGPSAYGRESPALKRRWTVNEQNA